MLKVTLGTNAYWSKGEGFADVIGLTVSSCPLQLFRVIIDRQLPTDHTVSTTVSEPGLRMPCRSRLTDLLRAGMCPGTALGFFWALGGNVTHPSVCAASLNACLYSRSRTTRAISILC